MLSLRVIPCLDVAEGRVVKGVQFVALKDAGDPVEVAARYDAEGADELVFLDISATHEGRETFAGTIRAVADALFIPLTVGGGIRTVDDFSRMLDAGADKVAVNSAAVADPTLVTRAALRFGSQCVVAAIDARGGIVYTHGGRRPTPRGLVDWARELVDRGAGELLYTSMDRDGTRSGYDIAGVAALRDAVRVPIIASGGAGEVAHFVDAARAGATGLLAASLFHYRELEIGGLKRALAAEGLLVRG